MATKSSNTKGNPYHDESSGRFTEADKSSSYRNEEKHFAIRFKSNIDIDLAKKSLAKKGDETTPIKPKIGNYRQASSIEEASNIGKEILPGCVVNYSNDCDLYKVNELNKALSDIANRFPSFVGNGLLNAYGDGLSLDATEIEDIITKSALNVIKNDPHFKKLYDEFFNISKSKYGLKDEDKYSESVLKHFMCFDSNFNKRDYVKKYSGGSALAYYQVTQDNIFNPNKGGKGINGAIKFYTSELKEATPREKALNDQAVKSGFHFPYGDKNYTYGTGVHELGHSIFTIAFKKCSDEERNEIIQILKDGKTKSYKEVSGYGHTNDYEQEAEAVADVMCRGENATPHNKKMVAWLDKVQNRLKNEII